METYLFKMILCSSIFIGFYYLILERQKAHRFKRFYLLSSILFSMLVPFVSITYGVVKDVSSQLVIVGEEGETLAPVVVKESLFSFENIIYGMYFLVTAILFVRFLISLNSLRQAVKTGQKIKRGKFTLVLQDEKATPHSFWNYIFVNRDDYERGKIDEKIILHEKTHLEQKHSFDVLLIEFLLTVFWFNPAFYFYKKAMLTNHEFLADERVLKYDSNIKSYQQLLLTELISERILFTNQFNLSNTKKRIKMMTTPNTKKSKLYAWLALPLTVIMFFAFVEKVPATNQELKTQNKPADQHFTKEDIEKIKSDDPFAEYQEILSKYSNLLNEKKYDEFNRKISDEDKKRLNELSALLTSEQKERLPVFSLKGESDESNSKKENYLIGVNKNLESKVDTLTPQQKKTVASLEKMKEEIDAKIQQIKENKAQYKVSNNETSDEEQASFPGGINYFRQRVSEVFNSAVFNGNEGTLKTTVYMTINEDGSVSDFRSEGSSEKFNTEVLRTVKFITENVKWNPAKKNGKPVKFIFKLPLTMNFS